MYKRADQIVPGDIINDSAGRVMVIGSKPATGEFATPAGWELVYEASSACRGLQCQRHERIRVYKEK